MKTFRAYKTEMRPTAAQAARMRRHIEASVNVWNWAHWRYGQHYDAWTAAKSSGGTPPKRPSAYDLSRELTQIASGSALRADKVSSSSFRQPLYHMAASWQAFFRNPKKTGRPRMKKLLRDSGSYSWQVQRACVVRDRAVHVPNIGWVRLYERGYLPAAGVKPLGMTVTQRAGRWWISYQVEEELAVEPAAGAAIGADVGVHNLLVASDGRSWEAPRSYRAMEERLKKLQRQVSRYGHGKYKRGSRRHRIALRRLATAHLRVAEVRRAAIHQATTELLGKGQPAAARPESVTIETLNVAGMTQNHRLAKSVNDASMSEVHRQISYKASWLGTEVHRADQWSPTSQTCSGCGAIDESMRDLACRTYVCVHCGLVRDRDLNAALNLKKTTEVHSESDARGDGLAGQDWPGSDAVDEPRKTVLISEHGASVDVAQPATEALAPFYPVAPALLNPSQLTRKVLPRCY